MANIRFIFLLTVIVIIAGCAPRGNDSQTGDDKAAPGSLNLSGKISISGAYALSPLAQAIAKGYQEKNPEVEFEFATTGTGAGLEQISNGHIHLAMVSRMLTDEERAAGFYSIPIAKDAVVLIVNRENPLLPVIMEKGIDPKSLSLLYAGDNELTWGDLVGAGSSDKITIFTRGDVSGAAALWAGFLFTTQENLKGIHVSGDLEMI
ncbi:MAG: hypothetical protein FJY11_06710 [Bacteroidetes bacterium]|nr:hypothetical protein [Bacteroidota bacterium]